MERDTRLYSDIIKNIRTTGEAQHCLSQIDVVLQQVYHQGKSITEIVKSTFPESIITSVLHLLDSQGVTEDRQKVHAYFAGLKLAIEQAKIVKLTLAITPQEDLLSELSDWAYAAFPDTAIFLDIQKDEAILGGAIVIYEGMYKDFSLKQALDDEFVKKQDELKKMLV